jgi:predicted transcriptional regulator
LVARYLIETTYTLDCSGQKVNLDLMEIRLAPDQEAHLAALAASRGSSADEIVGEAIARFLDDEARFAEAVKLGVAAADRGDFAPSDEVWAGVERILQS